MLKRIGTSIAAMALSIAGPALAQSAGSAPIAIQVDGTATGPKIDRNIFGQFAEHLGNGVYGGIWVGPDSPIPNVRGIRSDVVAALKAIRVPNVRWPGGCYADEYHWRDGVGPADKRRARINANWGDAVDPNTFGTHEFMDFIEQIDSEAYLNINLESGTVGEAAEWVEYMTAPVTATVGKERAANGHPAPYRIKYLGLGNESWGCGGAMSPESYTDRLKLFSRFLRNYNKSQTGESAMRRVAVGPDKADTEYTEAVMKAWKSRVWSWDIEGLSLHSYTLGGWPPSYTSTGFGTKEYAKLVAETLDMDRFITTHSTIMDKYDPEKKVALVVDEWGSWLAELPGTHKGFLAQQNSMRDAVIAALNINIFARHADRVRAANIAQMINVLQAMILTDGPKMVVTPTYHVFKMYVPFQDATFVPVRFDAGTIEQDGVKLPRVDAIAARDTQGKTWLALTNLDPVRPTRISATVAGVRARTATGQVLTAPRVDSINTFDAPDTVAPKPFSGRVSGGNLTFELPARSVAVVRLD